MRKLYDLTLVRLGRTISGMPITTRSLDLDEQADIDRFNQELGKVVGSLIKRVSNDPARDLHEYDLEVREHDKGAVVFTFHAVEGEVGD